MAKDGNGRLKTAKGKAVKRKKPSMGRRSGASTSLAKGS